MNKNLYKLLIISAAFALSSCGTDRISSSSGGNSTNSTENTSISVSESSVQSSEESSISSKESSESTSVSATSETSATSSEVTQDSSQSSSSVEESDFLISTTDGEYSKEGNIYTITSYGTYALSGTLNGQIYVNVPETDAGDSDVELDFNGVSISYDQNSPVYVASADNVKIKAKKKTSNYVTDLRPLEESEDETQGGGAIYAKSDLKFAGTGYLEVTGSYNNGIHTSKDLKIQKETLKVTAPNNAIKGSNSIKITSGDITAISTGGDGLKTSDNGTSSSGKQKGTVTITGGTLNIYSACDGIDAAYDVLIEEGVDEDDSTIATHPTINILTNKYSEYTDEIVSSSTEKMYLRTASYSSSYRYSVYFYGDDTSTGSWADATYLTSMRGGRNTTYYYYEVERPSSYESFKIFAFNTGDSNSLTSYVACSSGGTINQNYDTCTFSMSGSSISTGSWTNYSSQQQGGMGGMGPGGMQEEGNTDKSDVSAKGIKAANELTISDGTINIKAYDDGLHANYGEVFESGLTGAGNLYIKGGDTTIYASDDGVHADANLYISGGNLTVTNSYEGLEGNQIHISGGTSYAYATDDAVNAGDNSNTAGLTPLIEVTDGYLFAAVPASGDTDGIDSNGDYEQSGGVVIACGPSSMAASSLDVGDYNKAYVTGGTLVTFGKCAASFSNSSSITSSSKSGTYSNGTYLLTFASGTVTTKSLPGSYSGVYAYSSLGTLSNCVKQ